jgi:hypothetical protein
MNWVALSASKFEHGTSLPRWPQGVEQHPWDPMVEIPTPPEMGCGRLRYVWLCCSCVEHREGSHPMCEDAWSCTST